MADIFDVITKQRRGLDQLERETVTLLTQRWELVAKDLEKRYTTLLDELEFLRATGQEITIGRLYRTERARSLFIRAEQQYAEYAQLLGQETDKLIEQAARQALADADEITRYALGPLPDDAIGSGLFTRVPDQAINDLIATVQQGPLADILTSFGPDAAKGLQNALVTGLAYGENPLIVARRMARSMGDDLARARTIARTEMLRAYRESTRRWYEQNSKVVKGWVWHSALDTGTCVACWSMHGTQFDYNEPMGTHPNCRCTMVPKTKTWKELGFNVPDEYETSYNEPTGAQVFAKLSGDDQEAILGRTAKELYDAGELRLSDLVRAKHTREWGVTRSRGSLKVARERIAARGGRPIAPKPKPPKPAVPKPRTPKQPKAVPRTEYGKEIDRIKGNKTRADWNEVDIREAGAATRKEIGKRAKTDRLETEFRGLKIEQGDTQRRLRERMDDWHLSSSAVTRDAIEKEINTVLQPRLAQINARLNVLEPEISTKRIQATRDVLQEARGGKFGTSRAAMQSEGVSPGHATSHGAAFPGKRLPGGTDVDALRLFQEGSADFPDEWWDEFAAQSQSVRGGKGWRLGINDRGYYNGQQGEIYISAKGYADDRLIVEGMRSTVRHELGHAMEQAIPDIARLETEFYKRRTKGETLVRLRDLFGGGYRADERVRLDKFQHAYMGKDYGRGNHDFWEVFTMGIESALTPWEANSTGAMVLAKDEEFLDFILGILAAL